ncbi:MAG: hypothetical protein IBX56_12265 [Methylomicrobium sp.]|nr:hypothetical protein [Methylomicrobium sp.]
MNKQTIKGFIAWLETASDEAIAEKRRLILNQQKLIQTREGKADLRLALRLIDEECLARLELGRLQEG